VQRLTNSPQGHKWRDDLSSDGSRTCVVCGTTTNNDINVQRPKRKPYWDAHNKVAWLLEEPACPFYIGDGNSAIADLQIKTSKTKQSTEALQAQVEALTAQVEALRAAAATTITASDIADALLSKLTSSTLALEDKRQIIDMLWNPSSESFEPVVSDREEGT
jgi:hypothetical protein